MSVTTEIRDRAVQIDILLERYLPTKRGFHRVIYEAMNYSVRAGGKRLRPMLLRETARAFGASEEIMPLVGAFMAALEMIHTYSLVHDDLPAMDNDLLRRGKPTTHAVYGEAMAVLCGDALLNRAFETVTLALDASEPEQLAAGIKAAAILARRAGTEGMIGGQVADLLAEEHGTATLDEVRFIYDNKTGALLSAAMEIGAVLAGAAPAAAEKARKAGYLLGLAFQIQDDILDVTGDEAVLGKPIGSDERNAKPTYVALVGLDAAKTEVERLSSEVINLLQQMDADTAFLQELVVWLIDRDM